MKFALITADPKHNIRFSIDGEQGDCTSFMNWIDVWEGMHLSFKAMPEDSDISFLREFDVVMMSGHPSHMTDIVRIGEYLRDSETVTIFYPEGSTQLYDNSINGFQPLYYRAWNACDILSIAEEDKFSYYQAFITSRTLVRFIHVPLREEMERGIFFVPRWHKKENFTLVYGDNNPNHPLIALALANSLDMHVMAVDLRDAPVKEVFPNLKMNSFSKLAQYPYLRLLSRCIFQAYPTEWIGTARQQIACAVSGTPCIGSRDSHTQMRLFPDLAVGIYDVNRMRGLAKRLIDDKDFYQMVVTKAWDRVSFYGLERTKKRFTDAVDEAREIKKSKIMVATITFDSRKRNPGEITEATGL